MKISLIAPTHLPSRRANTIQVVKMAQAISALGNDVRMIVPGFPSGKIKSWDDVAHHYGLQHRFEIQWLPIRDQLRGYDYGIASVKQARRWGADLIYTRHPQAAAWASFWGVDTIYEIHDLPQGKVSPWLFQRFLKGSGARRLVVITNALREALAQQFAHLPPSPFTFVAPDGVDLARYQELPAPEIARQNLVVDLQMPNRFTAGYTGHLYAGRGVELILALAARCPDINFLLVGGNPQDVARVNHDEIAPRGLKNVFLTGFIPNADLPDYQAACDVFLMPYQRKLATSSGSDTAAYFSPLKVFEYFACGRAILSSDLPVLREILSTENAVLLPPADVDSWVDALKDLQHNPGKRDSLAEQARKSATAYSWSARAEQILSGMTDV